MKVTILTAVYNAEKYLRESLDSALSQTHKDIEVLCVDDCSTDSSWAVLQEYAAKDSRVRIWKQEKNQGQAVARNRALQHADGDVVMFLDADDLLSHDAVEKAVEAFSEHKDAGCVLFQCCNLYEDGRTEKYNQQPFSCLSGYDAFVKSLTWQIHGIYAVRADIHRQHPYDTSCRHYSDDNTTRIHYYVSKEVRECDGIYYYRQNAESVTHKVSTSRLDYLRANSSMRRQLIALNCSTDIIATYENHRWLNLLGVWLWYARHRYCFSSDERRYCLSEFRKAWESIDTAVLQKRNKLKPGYYPFRNHWLLFRIELELFAFARKFR